MRQIRNRSEYEGYAVGEQMVLTDLSHARAIVSAAQAALPPQPSESHVTRFSSDLSAGSG